MTSKTVDFPTLRTSCNDLMNNVVEIPQMSSNYATKLHRSNQEISLKVIASSPTKPSGFSMSNEDFPELSRRQARRKQVEMALLAEEQSDVVKSNNVTDSSNICIENSSSNVGEILSRIPVNMIKDHFGIAGLLSFMRNAECEQIRLALAPGLDLTSMGLNMNASLPVHKNLVSPFLNASYWPNRLEEERLPEEYYVSDYVSEYLAPLDESKYSIDLLFFQFYLQIGDVAQMYAAYELYRRGWRFLIDSQRWIARLPGTEPYQRTSTSEQGRYYFFDPNNWERLIKDMTVEYDKLDRRPSLPADLLNVEYYAPLVDCEET